MTECGCENYHVVWDVDCKGFAKKCKECGKVLEYQGPH